jgi:type I restriction enzyme R subunit
MEDPSAYLNPYQKIDQHGSLLPHWQQGDALQFMTFRQKDALPQSKLNEWRVEKVNWCATHPKPWTPEITAEYNAVFTQRIEQWLDAGMGSCLFKKASNREQLAQVLMRAQPANAELRSWVIMPNHVHVLFRPLRPLPELIKAWKRTSAKNIARGSIWQRNYRDTLIRNAEHYARSVRYIRKNPEKLPPGTFTLWESDSAQRIT